MGLGLGLGVGVRGVRGRVRALGTVLTCTSTAAVLTRRSISSVSSVRGRTCVRGRGWG